MIILLAVFSLAIGNEKATDLLTTNSCTNIILKILTIHGLCRFFFHGKNEMENGSCYTSDKIMAGLAGALCLSFSAILLATRYLQTKQ